MKKKILIKQIDDAYNYGNAMMGMIFVDFFYKKYGDEIEIYTDINRDEYIEYYKTSIGVSIKKESFSFLKKTRIPFINIIISVTNAIKYSKEINKYDFIYFLGGDYFTQYYGWQNMFIKMLFILKTKKNKVYLLGQTFGKFSPFFKFIAARLLQDVIIYTRDFNSYEYVKKILKIKNVNLSRDIAFLPLPNETSFEYKKLLDDFNLEEDNYVVIVLTGLNNKYTKSKENFINNWLSVIDYLCKRDDLPNVVLLAHVVTNKPSSDLHIINEISEKALKFPHINKKLKIINNLLTPLEARIILGKGLFTLTCRMHAAISTFEMGKPAVAISYSIKYYGVIAEGLELPNLIIEASNDKFWSDEKLLFEIKERIEYILKNYNELSKKIKKNCLANRTLSLSQLTESTNKVLN
jgi:colanic acid/amylovoran biosynthesis protein